MGWKKWRISFLFRIRVRYQIILNNFWKLVQWFLCFDAPFACCLSIFLLKVFFDSYSLSMMLYNVFVSEPVLVAYALLDSHYDCADCNMVFVIFLLDSHYASVVYQWKIYSVSYFMTQYKPSPSNCCCLFYKSLRLVKGLGIW